MNNLFNQILKVLKKYNLSIEDKEDIAQNCMIYCYRSNIGELPMSHIRQIVKTQTRLFLRPTYRKINLLMPEDMDYSSVIDNNALDSMENKVQDSQIEKVIMDIKVIPFVYRKAIAYYILEEYTFKEAAEKLNLNSDKIRYYLRTNASKIESLLTGNLLSKVKSEVW